MTNRKRKTKSKAPVMPGLDYGVERTAAVMTAPDFNSNMGAAKIIACAYGQLRAPGLGSVVPCISMVAKKPEFLKEAFLQFKAWIDATGPDALKVEILYSDLGYYISFGPDYQHAMWRTIGVDQLQNPMFYGITYIKTIDTRNPILDQIAAYSKHAVAPVMVLGAHYTGDKPSGVAPNPSEIAAIPGCPDLLLLHLPVYKTKAEVPRFSGLMSMASEPSDAQLEKSRKDFDAQAKSPAGIARSRESRMSTLMPVTLHMLRTFEPLKAKIVSLEAEGLMRWQIEQAIINHRLWSLIDPARRARFQNANDMHKSIGSFMELDSPDWNSIADDREAILKQGLRDARMLLKAVGVKAPDTIQACQVALEASGHLKPDTSVA